NLSEVNPNANNKVWQRYGLDLRDMIKKDPGAIYQVRIGFQKAYTDCLMNPNEPGIPYWQKVAEEGNDDDFISQSIMGGSSIYWPSHSYDGYGDGDDYYYDDYDESYDWEQRDEPCQLEYYNSEHFTKRNVFVSDIGMTAKRGRDGSLFLAVTDLHTAQPIQNVELELLTYQLQTISKVKTDSDGTVMVEGLRESPFVVVATNGNRRGYLRMADGATLSLSRFDVAGVEAQRGLKGYIYGERGVWRPGDSLFLNFVLEDKSGKFPANHPVTMELTDPMGSLQQRMVQTNSVNGVYAFHTATRPEARTGNWTCTIKVGGAEFTKTLKIETVKPNRLKMDLDFGKKELSIADNNLNGYLNVKWLHGAVANGLKAKVELQMRSVKTEFKNYKNYAFDDPSRGFYSEPEVLFDGDLNANGQATVPMKFGNMNEAPGKIIASFKVRAFENGGDFSTDNFALDVFPYNRFAGIYIPTDKWGSKTISERGTGVTFVLVDKTGRPVPNTEVNVALYRVDWRWWWDEDAGVSNFNSSEVNNAVDQATLVTDARGQVQWKVQPNQWG
ncbi:MAG: MG2 domain-containing protein, partial [Saprospiraceae bacterium]